LFCIDNVVIRYRDRFTGKYKINISAEQLHNVIMSLPYANLC